MTTTAAPSTTPEECAEDLDNYEPVTVTREDFDTGSPISPDEWWIPDNPPENQDSPYDGSHVTVTFNPRSEVTSVIVKNKEGEVEELRLAFEFQPSDRLPYIPLVDETNSGIFIGNTGSKIPLPPSLPFVTSIRVYIVGPNPDTSYQVIFNGCEEKGNFSLTKLSRITKCYICYL